MIAHMTATQQRQSVSVQPYMLLNSFALNNPPTSSSKFRSMNEESIQDLVPFPRLIPPFRTQHKVSVETLLSCLLRIANSSDTPRIAASKLDVGESQLPYFLEEHTVDDFQIAGAWIEDDWIIRLIITEPEPPSCTTAAYVLVQPPPAWAGELASAFTTTVVVEGIADAEGFARGVVLNKRAVSLRPIFAGTFPHLVTLDLEALKAVVLSYRSLDDMDFYIEVKPFATPPPTLLLHLPFEMFRDITSHLDLASYSALADVNRSARDTILNIIEPALIPELPHTNPPIRQFPDLRDRILTVLVPFIDEIDAWRSMWAETSASWVGSGPTSILTGAAYPVNDLDWIVNRMHADRFRQQLIAEGYQEEVIVPVAMPDDALLDYYLVGDAERVRYRHPQKNKFIDLILVGPDTTPNNVIDNYHSTIVMNRINFDTAHIYYTSLTTRNLMQFKYDPNDGIPNKVHVAIKKYCHRRGFRFDGFLPPPINPAVKDITSYGW